MTSSAAPPPSSRTAAVDDTSDHEQQQQQLSTIQHPHLRLCRLALPTNIGGQSPSSPAAADRGYGFNVHAERYRVGHYVGSVVPGSPAEQAGLRPGDRVVEVDGRNVETESYSEFVETMSAKMKAGDRRLTVLVVDEKTDQYFKDHGVRLSADLAVDGAARKEVVVKAEIQNEQEDEKTGAWL